MDPNQVEIFKTMPPQKKWQLALKLYYSAWRLKEMAIKDQHSNWSQEKIKKTVRTYFINART